MNRLAHHIMITASAIMPPEQQVWARAMQAEFSHIKTGRAGFAVGCLWSAIMANLVDIARMTQLGFGLLAVLLLGLAGNTAWFTVSYLPNFASNPPLNDLADQLAFALGHLSQAVIALIGAGGAGLACRAARNRPLAAEICAKTISIVTLWFAAIFVILVTNALLAAEGANSLGLAMEMITLCIAPFALAGLVGLGGPNVLPMPEWLVC
jgi:hypothetical protein